MKLNFIGLDSDFIGLDLIPEGIEDRQFCRKINQAFKAGDLHMRIDGSCLFIEYDGESRSFKIKKKECELIEKSLKAVFKGIARFLVGSVMVYDESSKGYYCICILRFSGKIKEGTDDFQQKITISYIPPLSFPERKKPGARKKPLSIQEKLTDESFFVQKRPLFPTSRIKSTKQSFFK
jgi:hypothetical protein